MKTLYVNINGLNIQNSVDIYVVGKPEDAIINKFYYELGVDASVSRDIDKKGIITDVMSRSEGAKNSILNEWEEVKDKLLVENPTGFETIEFPMEYVIQDNFYAKHRRQ